MPTLVRLFFRDKTGERKWPTINQVKVAVAFTPQCEWSYYAEHEKQYIMTLAFQENIGGLIDLQMIDLHSSIKFVTVKILGVTTFYRTVDVLQPEMEFFTTKIVPNINAKYVYFPISEDNRLLKASFSMDSSGTIRLQINEPCPTNSLFIFAIIQL